MKNYILIILIALSINAHAQSVVWSKKCHDQQRETYGVAYSIDGSKVISGSECHPASIRLWDAQNGDMIWDYNVGNVLMCQTSVKMSASGQYVGSMEESGNLIILQHNTGNNPTLLYTINVGSGGSYSLDFSPDNNYVAVDGNSNKVKIYKLSDGNLEKTLTGHAGDVISVVYSPDGSKILSGSADNTAKLWDTSGTIINTIPNLGSDVVCVRFNADGSKFFVATKDGLIKIYDTVTYAELASISSPETLNQIAVSTDGTWLIAGCDTSARLFSTVTGANVATFNTLNGGKVYSVAFEPNGTKVVIGNSNGDVTVFSLLNIVSGIDANKTSLSFSMYPNPTANFLVFSREIVNHDFMIYDSKGSFVMSGVLSQNKVDVSALLNGNYLIKISNESSTGIKSFIKN